MSGAFEDMEVESLGGEILNVGSFLKCVGQVSRQGDSECTYPITQRGRTLTHTYTFIHIHINTHIY